MTGRVHRGRWPALVGFLACALGMAVGGAQAEEAVATDSPGATIASLQRGLVATAREHAHASVAERYRLLEPLILATHDLPYIAEFALRRQWGGLGEAERQQFVAAFTRLSVMTYAARFGNIGPDSFRPLQETAAPAASGRAEVATAVARAGQADIPLEYLLQHDEAGWRIVNVVADGVSDLALKRAEYQRLFAAGAMPGLLAELEAQTERLLSN